MGTQQAAENQRTGWIAAAYQKNCRPFIHATLAGEISRTARYFDQVVQVLPRPEDRGELLRAVDNARKTVANRLEDIPDLLPEMDQRAFLLLNGNLNHHYDIEGLLRSIRAKCSRSTRVGVVFYNSYLRSLYRLANRLGVRAAELPATFCTNRNLQNIASLAGFEVVRARPAVYMPFPLGGLGVWLNGLFAAAPVLRWFGFAEVLILRPVAPTEHWPSLSIVIPARNEKGNIENALKRIPRIGDARLEVIFVEGHSSDGTWEEIQRVVDAWKDRFTLQAHRQTGKGKSDAVRLGFSRATGDLLTILDADLTMPPELLPRFYEAWRSGRGDFINGNRLVYPMEGEAMRFLNHLGNLFFARALSFVLDTPLGDSLCGTKLMSRTDYARMIRWRHDFGDFDPFGDFEIIFPACTLGLGVVDMPIRYLARTYGTTNIHRFRHGLVLLRMTLVGFFRIRWGAGPR
ncbi:MAG: glycosyltransferase family 2 protein [Bdellovibrionales bacterium]|nr:glycosyltransferase family 2 protein [Bdellovibrionales bacterium]